MNEKLTYEDIEAMFALSNMGCKETPIDEREIYAKDENIFENISNLGESGKYVSKIPKGKNNFYKLTNQGNNLLKKMYNSLSPEELLLEK
jgi:hypothetical protein